MLRSLDDLVGVAVVDDGVGPDDGAAAVGVTADEVLDVEQADVRG